MELNGDGYQIRIINQDGTVELSGWMNSTEQVVHTLAATHRSRGKVYWLLVRMKDQIILECPIADIPSPRYSPPDSYNQMRLRSGVRYVSD
jgi:hypothetical protein